MNRNFRKRVIYIFCVLLILFFIPFTAYADVPRTLNYQGYIEDDLGAPLEGAYDMTFSIYDVDTGGTALWDDTIIDVTVVNGVAFVVDVLSVIVVALSAPIPGEPVRDRSPGGPPIRTIPSPACPVGMVLPEIVAGVMFLELVAHLVAAVVTLVPSFVAVLDSLRPTVDAVIHPVGPIVHAITGPICPIVHALCTVTRGRPLQRLRVVQKRRRCAACHRTACHGAGTRSAC